MRDQRLPFIRRTLDAVVESLEATIRVERWTDAEDVPEPLVKAAARLVERLGAADRVATSAFSGTPEDVKRVTAMIDAMKRLDAAYVAYRRASDTPPGDVQAAASLLVEELDRVKHEIQA